MLLRVSAMIESGSVAPYVPTAPASETALLTTPSTDLPIETAVLYWYFLYLSRVLIQSDQTCGGILRMFV